MARLLIPFVLCSAGGDPALALSASGASGGGGRRYRKDAIRVGRYVARNPIDGSDLELDVTPQRLRKWVENFHLMRQGGVKVDLTVDHQRGAAAKRGEVVAMSVEGDRLLFDAELADEEGEKLIHRCPEVSVEIEPNFRDGTGRTYGEAITAISVCRKPVVPGQQPFTRIAASRQDDADGHPPGAALWFAQRAADPTGPTGPGDNPMFTAEQLKEIRSKLKLGDDAKDEQIAQKLLLSLDAAAQLEEARQKLQEAEGKVKTLTDELEQAKAKSEPVKLSRDVQGVLEEAVDAKLSTLVEQAKITPAVAKQLGELFKQGGAVMLSREANGGEKSRAMQILDILAESKAEDLAKLLGEKAGAQVIALSRQTPEGSKTEPDDWVKKELEKANAGK